MKKIFWMMVIMFIVVTTAAFASTISREGAPGCVDKEYLQKVINYASQGDGELAEKVMDAGFRSGSCVSFERSEKVFVVDRGLGFVQVHRVGETQGYWTVSEVVVK